MAVLTEDLNADVRSILTTEAAFLAYLKPKQIGGTTDTLRLIQKNAAGTGIAVAVSDDSLQLLKAGTQTSTGNKTWTGTHNFQNLVQHTEDVTMAENSELIFKDGENPDITNRIINIDNYLGMLGWDDSSVTDYAPVLGVANWNDDGGFVVSAGQATYTHSAGTGEISFDSMAVEMPRARWMKITYTISGSTGSASTFIMTTPGGKILPVSDGTFSDYFFSGNHNDEANIFTLSVSSSASGSFIISNIKLESSDTQVLRPQSIELGALVMSAENRADQIGVDTLFRLGGDTNDGHNRFRLFCGDSNQEFSMLLDEFSRSVLFNTQSFDVTSFNINNYLSVGDAVGKVNIENTDSTPLSVSNNIELDFRLNLDLGGPFDAMQIRVIKDGAWSDPDTLGAEASFYVRTTDGISTQMTELLKLSNFDNFIGDKATGDCFIQVGGGPDGLDCKITCGDSGTGFELIVAGSSKITFIDGDATIVGAGIDNTLALAAKVKITDPGDASESPFTLPVGVLTTGSDIESGDFEYDGKAFYATPNSVFNRGVLATIHTRNASSDLGGEETNTVQPWFPTLGACNLAANMTYRFRGRLLLSNGATAHTIGTSFGGTAGLTNLGYVAESFHGASGATSTASNFTRVQVATNVTISSSTTLLGSTVLVEGTVRITTAGTFIPQFTFSANPTGTTLILTNSFFEIFPIGSDTMTNVGNWT